MATYLRPQLQTRIAAPKRQPYLHDVLNRDLLTTTLAAAPAGVPFLPTVWPAPRGRSKSYDFLTWLNPGLQGAVVVQAPFFNGYWPNPVAARRGVAQQFDATATYSAITLLYVGTKQYPFISNVATLMNR